MPARPDFPALIAHAQANRKPVPLDRACHDLGDLFDEHALARETLVIRGDDYALTPTAWVRLVQRAHAQHAGRAS